MGCALAVFGIWLISGDARASSDGDEGSNLPGILLCLAVVAAGFVLLHFFRELPASTAGVTAIVLGLPALMVFLTFDVNSSELVSLEAVLGGSALVWLIAYLVGPGAGRPVLLGVALLFGWLFVIQAVEDPFQSGLETPTLLEEGPLPGVDDPAPPDEDDPFADDLDDDLDDEFADDEFGTDVGDDFGSESSGSATTVGIISVLFGAGYLVGARLLDRRGVPGPGVPLSFVGHVALPVGVVFLSEDLEAVGTGIAFVVIGGLAIWSGALGSRRATTVIGAIEIFVGIILVIGEFMDDSSATSVGVTFFVVGALIVLAAQLLHSQTGETPQLTPGPSQFPGSPGRRSVTPYAGYPPGSYPAPGPYGPGGGPPPTYPGRAPATAPPAPARPQPRPAAQPPPPPPPPPPPAGGSGV
jgi:hypothetical protein